MNAIIGFTDQALLTNLPAKTKSYLEKVVNSSRFLLRIIDDILDFSKIEAGKMELENIAFNLSNLLHNLTDLFVEKAAKKNIATEHTSPF